MPFYASQTPQNLIPALGMFLDMSNRKEDRARQLKLDEAKAKSDALHDQLLQQQLDENKLTLSDKTEARAKTKALDAIDYNQFGTNSVIHRPDGSTVSADYRDDYQKLPEESQDKVNTVYRSNPALNKLSVPEIAQHFNSVVHALTAPKVEIPSAPAGTRLKSFNIQTPSGTAAFEGTPNFTPTRVTAPDTGATLGYDLNGKILDLPKPETTAKPVGDEILNKLNVADLAMGQLPKYEKLVNESGDAGGPMSSRLGAPLAYLFGPGQDRLAYDTLQAQTLAPIAKGILGETGALSDADLKRYAPLLPAFSDTAETRKTKLSKLKELIEGQRGNILNNLKASGRDVSGFNQAPSQDNDAKANQVRADFKSGKITRDEAKKQLQSLGMK